ncbi:unnamed protein product [Clonostachys solani]|uniref:Aldehyde dehydrogenase domain-containing protein n=1 Tax=Clonostachys solani TaxID=160281 RepID=A0A9N9Z7V5_9HYPO|nr:unnamed protein product [Clonostachys solani]
MGILKDHAGFADKIHGEVAALPAPLASHMDASNVALTGSITTGRESMKLAANNLKSVTLETSRKLPLSPQVSKFPYERVLSYIEKGKQKVATVKLGGKPY